MCQSGKVCRKARRSYAQMGEAAHQRSLLPKDCPSEVRRDLNLIVHSEDKRSQVRGPHSEKAQEAINRAKEYTEK